MNNQESIRYTLLGDGSSDDVLLYPITWLLKRHIARPILPIWADLSRLRNPPKPLANRITLALDLYPCDVLFVHRDAEHEPFEVRVNEIQRALASTAVQRPVVCVVPVRMQEAWLLFDEAAIRRAAGNPRSHAHLNLPRIAHIESLADPKSTLHDALRGARDAKGHDKRRFHPYEVARRIGEIIEDFSPLQALPAFQRLEADIQALVQQQGW